MRNVGVCVCETASQSMSHYGTHPMQRSIWQRNENQRRKLFFHLISTYVLTHISSQAHHAAITSNKLESWYIERSRETHIPMQRELQWEDHIAHSMMGGREPCYSYYGGCQNGIFLDGQAVLKSALNRVGNRQLVNDLSGHLRIHSTEYPRLYWNETAMLNWDSDLPL